MQNSAAFPVDREKDLLRLIRREGYFQFGTQGSAVKLVKHPWGYWGGFLLHAGMVIGIASALLIFLTEQRGVATIVEGETFAPGGRWVIESSGMLGRKLVLPEALRVDRVTPEFWETDDEKQLTTAFSFITSQGAERNFEISINQMLNYHGVQIYQKDFGNAFFLQFVDKDGKVISRIIQMAVPSRRNEPSYDNFTIEGIPYRVKAKYYADAGQRFMVSADPLLVLRLAEQDAVVGEVSLRVGTAGSLGPYSVKLVAAPRWVGLIFVSIKGMVGLYCACFIIILGGALSYFTQPREIVVTKDDRLVVASWNGGRFARLYMDEFERVVAEMAAAVREERS